MWGRFVAQTNIFSSLFGGPLFLLRSPGLVHLGPCWSLHPVSWTEVIQPKRMLAQYRSPVGESELKWLLGSGVSQARQHLPEAYGVAVGQVKVSGWGMSLWRGKCRDQREHRSTWKDKLLGFIAVMGPCLRRSQFIITLVPKLQTGWLLSLGYNIPALALTANGGSPSV